MENYLQILIESLEKKSEVLRKMNECDELQFQAFSSEEPDYDAFDKCIEVKDALIQELESLDDGFESLFEKVSEHLKANKSQYATEIRKLQELVQKVTDQSVVIQAQEARNRDLIENFFRQRKSQLGDGRRSAQAAMRYYRNQNNTDFVPPQFMDDKK